MKKRFPMVELDCAHCAAKMEDAIRKLEGVHSVSVNFLTQKLTIDAEESLFPRLQTEISAICKKIEPDCTIKW